MGFWTGKKAAGWLEPPPVVLSFDDALVVTSVRQEQERRRIGSIQLLCDDELSIWKAWNPFRLETETDVKAMRGGCASAEEKIVKKMLKKLAVMCMSCATNVQKYALF